MIERTLSHYRITTELGAGGMGEVYRAEDSRLGRDVAIKILPEVFTQDQERLARFEREARMLAALDHPNIATIFEVDQAEETHFLVMQLAEGETIADRIKRGPIPVEESLEIARQIAEALEYAHAKGIIHRDLKPANVMVGPNGQVKVLDFGLAKALEHGSKNIDDSALLSASPTLTRDMTREGVILGTAAYMSPEQAKGEAVDTQADIWAFGCVLYEMLSGHRTNPGNSSAEVIAKILEAEPLWGALPAQTPPAIRRLLRRCLAKDPKNRLQSIADARIEIEEAGQPVDEAEVPVPAVEIRPRWLAIVPWALCGVLALIAVALLWRSGTRPASQLTTRFSLPGHRLALGEHPVAPIVAISADGSLMAYIEGEGDTGQLFLRRMDSFESIAVKGASEAQSPFFSPDGKWLAFAADGQLKKVSVEGGRPQDICPIEVLHGATWAPDGTIIFNTAAGLMRIPETGGRQEVVTEEDPERNEVGHHTPQILPNGDVLFTTVASGAAPLEIVLYSPVSGERRTLVEGGSNALYVSSGHLLWAEEGSLMAAALNLETGKLEGAPIPVADRLMMGFSNEPGRAHFTVSENGTLAYVAGPSVGNRSTLVRIGQTGEEEPLGRKFARLSGPRFSPDGRRVAVGGVSPGEDSLETWVMDLERGTSTLLTPGTEGDAGWPIWSQDGAKLVINMKDENDDWVIAQVPADGSSKPEALVKADAVPGDWTPDGKGLILQVSNQPTGWDIGLFRLGSDQEVEIILGEKYDELHPDLSPDGRWLAYVSDESDRREVYVRAFPELSRRWQISNQGGDEPQWSADGGKLFYREGQRIMAVEIATLPELSPGIPAVLLDTGMNLLTGYSRSFDIAPDGKSFLVTAEAPPDPDELELRMVLNWFIELERLVPTD